MRCATFLLAFLLITLNSCHDEKRITKDDLLGVWGTVTNDSLYDEVIITPYDFYVYDENAGDLLLTYKVENDSLKIFYYGGLQSSRKIKLINKNEFVETDGKTRIIFKRLPVEIDTFRILSTKRSLKRKFDQEYYWTYVNDLRERRSKWDSARNANR